MCVFDTFQNTQRAPAMRRGITFRMQSCAIHQCIYARVTETVDSIPANANVAIELPRPKHSSSLVIRVSTSLMKDISFGRDCNAGRKSLLAKVCCGGRANKGGNRFLMEISAFRNVEKRNPKFSEVLGCVQPRPNPTVCQ